MVPALIKTEHKPWIHIDIGELNMNESDNVLKFDINGIELVMVKCPAGTFMMGSPEDEIGRHLDETQHLVKLTRDFYIGKYPVTEQFFKKFMPDIKRNYCMEDLNKPINSVDPYHIYILCNRLNDLTSDQRPLGYNFNLPTEAQWEYACRAGTTTSFNNGTNISLDDFGKPFPNLDDVGWYSENSDSKIHPVGLKKPNAWGIYDMHGNILELCDDYDDVTDKFPEISIDPIGKGNRYLPYRVARGGYCRSSISYCRSAFRHKIDEEWSVRSDLGFRLALVWNMKS